MASDPAMKSRKHPNEEPETPVKKMASDPAMKSRKHPNEEPETPVKKMTSDPAMKSRKHPNEEPETPVKKMASDPAMKSRKHPNEEPETPVKKMTSDPAMKSRKHPNEEPETPVKKMTSDPAMNSRKHPNEEPETPVKKMTSDPAMLRAQIRTYQEAKDGLREGSNEDWVVVSSQFIYFGAFSNMAEEKEELMMELTEEKPTIATDIPQESPNEVDEVGKEQETGSPAVGDLNQMVAALEKENLKRTLAETEIKLSEAFREISDLRMMDHDAHPMLAPAPEVDHNIEVMNSHLTEFRAKIPNTQRSKLPPIQTPQEGSQLEEAVKYELTSKQSRELKLFQAGDMQGKGDKGDEETHRQTDTQW
ncbi:hypothetical protein DPMN_002240 [Dreissena polymorpha]|uniref:Uncharacterized protein n=1 Tax=Dreissena polymorpha TaxID=45954 RepID=A0A9D4MN99_DREPO|nr:hypothetical protein DPMN_002240 [Dreissena polymorpha]